MGFLHRSLWVLCALYFLGAMHFFMGHRGGAGLDLPFNAWAWMFVSLAIGLGLWMVASRRKLNWSPLQSTWWLAAVLLVLPMLYPGQEVRAYAIPRLLGLLAGLLFLWTLSQWSLGSKGRERLLYLVLGGVALEAVLGLVQYFFMGLNNPMGYDARLNRPTGIFQQVNVMASLISTGLMLALWLEGRAMRQPQDPEGQPIPAKTMRARQALCALRWGMMVAAGLLLVVIQSRVGQLGAILGLLLMAPWLRSQRKLALVLGLVGLGAGLGLLAQALGAGAEGTGAVQRGLEAYKSIGVRSAYWSTSLQMVLASPWRGWGYGGFEAAFLEFHMSAKLLKPELPDLGGFVTHPHNELLYWAVEGGLLPLLGLLLMGLALLGRALQAPQRSLGLALLGMLLPLLLHTQTEYPFYHAVVLWLVFIVLVHQLDAEVEDRSIDDGRPARWRELTYRPVLAMRSLGLLIPLVVLPFMLTALHTLWLVTRYENGRYEDTSLMGQVINPVALLGRVEFGVNTPVLIGALMTGNMQAIQGYAEWALGFVHHSPRPSVYIGLVQSLITLGRLQEAEAVRKKALILYPSHTQLQLLQMSAAAKTL